MSIILRPNGAAGCSKTVVYSAHGLGLLANSGWLLTKTLSKPISLGTPTKTLHPCTHTLLNSNNHAVSQTAYEFPFSLTMHREGCCLRNTGLKNSLDTQFFWKFVSVFKSIIKFVNSLRFKFFVFVLMEQNLLWRGKLLHSFVVWSLFYMTFSVHTVRNSVANSGMLALGKGLIKQ